MSVVFVSFIDPLGKKGSSRTYISDDEDEIEFLKRINFDLVNLKLDGYHVLRVEVT